MAMRKFQSVEKTVVLSPEEQAQISANLHTIGKTSAQNLSEEERKALDAQRRL